MIPPPPGSFREPPLDSAGARWEDGNPGARPGRPGPTEEATMRYLLLWHTDENELRERSPEWHEEIAAFLTRFEDELASTSELEWTEVLAPEAQAVMVGPGPVARDRDPAVEGKPLGRVWAVRAETRDRVVELASELAGELDAWIEVRAALPGSQRP